MATSLSEWAARRLHMSGTYKDLEVWQAAMQFAVQVYRLTAVFPKEERYGLTSQMRAAVSVPSNIAEGKGRSSRQRAHPVFVPLPWIALRDRNPDCNRRAVGLFDDGGVQRAPTRSCSNWSGDQRIDSIRSPAHRLPEVSGNFRKPEAESRRADYLPRMASRYATTFLLCSSMVRAKR